MGVRIWLYSWPQAAFLQHLLLVKAGCLFWSTLATLGAACVQVELQSKALDMGITDLTAFFNSPSFSNANFELDESLAIFSWPLRVCKKLRAQPDRESQNCRKFKLRIYKLELEQKRLEEDAFVYNWLQEQLKVSPAYKKMLEIGACLEMKEKSRSLVESADDDFSDISFEELLAQEKKDVFWQKNGRLRPCTG